MKKIKFIPFFCGLLFFGNSSSLCPYQVNIYINPGSEDDFYNEYSSDLKESNKPDNGGDLAFYSREQEATLKRLTCSKSFLSVFELGEVEKKGTLGEEFITYALENVKNDTEEIKLKKNIDDNDEKIEYIHENGCSARKLILDMALDYDTHFYVKMPRMFLAVPNEDKYTRVMNNIFRKSEEVNDIKNDIINTFINYYCLARFYLFLDKGEGEFNFILKKLKKMKNYPDPEFNESVYKSHNGGGQMLLLMLLPRDDLDVVNDAFIEYCKKDFEKKGKLKKNNNYNFDEDNMYQKWITLLEDSRGKFIVGLSKVYIYCPLPDGYFEKAYKLIEKLTIQLLFEKGFLYGSLGCLARKIVRKFLY